MSEEEIFIIIIYKGFIIFTCQNIYHKTCLWGLMFSDSQLLIVINNKLIIILNSY